MQYLIDKFLKKLAAWKAKWISMAGRLTLTTAVLSALPAYQLIAILQPKWMIKQMDKLHRAFLWAADDKVSGGKCLMNWTKVCMPKSLGGLGIPNLHIQSIALRTRWLWQQATDRSKPWLGLPLPIDGDVAALFRASTTITINCGADVSFWFSHWCQGQQPSILFPDLLKHSRLKKISVRDAIQGEDGSLLSSPIHRVWFLCSM